MYTQIHTHIHMHIHKLTHGHTCTHTDRYINIHTYMHTHTYTHIHTESCMYIHTGTCIYPNIHAHSYICIHIYMYTHMFLATAPQRNLVPRPLSESSNLAGAFAALVWAWLKRHPTSWGLFHWKIRTKWIINPLGPKSNLFLKVSKYWPTNHQQNKVV